MALIRESSSKFEEDRKKKKQSNQSSTKKTSGSSGSSGSSRSSSSSYTTSAKKTSSAPSNAYSDSGSYQRAQTAKQNRTTSSSQRTTNNTQRTTSSTRKTTTTPTNAYSDSGSYQRTQAAKQNRTTNTTSKTSSSHGGGGSSFSTSDSYNKTRQEQADIRSRRVGNQGKENAAASAAQREQERQARLDRERETSVRRQTRTETVKHVNEKPYNTGLSKEEEAALIQGRADYLRRSDPELSSRLAGSYAGNVQYIVNSLSNGGYKDKAEISKLLTNYDNAKAELVKMRMRGMDTSEAEKSLAELGKALHDQTSYYTSFKNKDEYDQAQWAAQNKGKSYKEIQQQIDVRSRRLGNEGQNLSAAQLRDDTRELNWLEKNKYNYMSQNELLNELKKTYEDRAQEAPNLKERFRTGDVSKHTGNRADYDYKIERLQDALKNSSDKSSLPERLWNDSDISTGGAVTWRDRLKYAEQDYERFASSLNLQRSDDKALSKLVSDKKEYFYRGGDGRLKKGTAEELIKEYVARQDYQEGSALNRVFTGGTVGEITPQFINATNSIASSLSNAGYNVAAMASAYERYRNEKEAEEREEKIRGFASKNLATAALASAATVATNLAGPAVAAIGTLGRAATAGAYDNTRKLADVNDEAYAATRFTTEARDAAAEKISSYFKTDVGKTVANIVYGAGMSLLDMAAAFATGYGIAGKGTKAAERIVQAVMSSSAGTSEFVDSIQNGASMKQAVATSIAAAGFEALFEKVSIGMIADAMKTRTPAELIKKMLVSIFAEGTEEVNTDLANMLADSFINGDNSKYNRSVVEYMKAGQSAASAKSMATIDTLKQLGESFAGGALAGGASVGMVGANALYYNARENRAKVKADIDTGRATAPDSTAAAQTISNIKELSGETKLSEKEQKKIDSDIRKAEKAQAKIESREQDGKKKAVTKKSAYDIGKAVNDVRELSAESAVSSIRKNAIADRITQLDKDGRLNAQNVDALANAVYEAYVDEKSGKRTSRENISLITNSPIATTVRNELRAYEERRAATPWITAAREAEITALDEIDERVESGDRRAEIQPVGEFAARTSNGEAVTVTAIENTRNGIKVRLSDGTNGVINSQSRKGDIVFDNEEDERLFTAAGRAGGAREANAFISAYQPGIDIAEYTREWNEAYTAGLLGRTETVDPSTASRSPSPWQGRLDAAYQAGVERRNSGRIDALEIGHIIVDAAPRNGVTVLSKGGTEALSENARQTLKLADAYGRAHGISYAVVDTIGTGKANALYAEGTNTIFVAADNPEGSIAAAVGHDTWHYITDAIRRGGDENANQYIKDRTAQLLETLDSLPGYDLEARRNQLRDLNEKLGKKLTESELDEELVGNGMWDLITNDEAVRSLAESDAKNSTNFIQWIKEALGTVIEKIRNTAARYGVAEARALVNAEEALARFNEVGNEAIRLADQARQSSTAHRAVNDQGSEISDQSDNRFMIREEVTADDGKTYKNVVLLDSDVLKNTNRHNRNKVFTDYVRNNFAGVSIPVYNENGEQEIISFAKKNERVLKDGATNKHKVLDKLATKRKPVEMSVVLNSEEVLQTSRENGGSDDHSHQWLDQNGWKFRTAYVQTSDGKLYAVNLNIAQARDGRNIFYDVNDTKKIGVGNVPSSPEQNSGRSRRATTTDYDGSVSQPTENVNTSGMKFMAREPVEETKELLAVHNVSEEKLISSLELGGLPAPSIAVFKAKAGHTKFGNISLIFDKDTIDPRNRNNNVYGADAYTPVAPRVESKINEKARRRLEDAYYDLNKKYGDRARGLYALGNYAEDEINRKGLERTTSDLKSDNLLKEVYLLEKGHTLPDVEAREELVYAAPATQEEAEKEARYILFRDKFASGIEEFKKLSDLHARIQFARNHENEIRSAMKEAGVQDAGTIPWTNVASFFAAAQRYDPTKKRTVTDRSKRDEYISKNADKEGYQEWIDSLLDGIIEKKGIYNDRDPYTPSGNRRSWEYLHWEYTLENIITAMKKLQSAQGHGFAGMNLFGSATKKYSSIAEIQADSDRLQSVDVDSFNEYRQGFLDRFHELAENFAKYDSLDNYRAAGDLLLEALTQRKTVSGIASYLKKEGAGWTNYSDWIVDDLIKLGSDVAEMPTEYFEAKPMRAVGLDEIRGAVIPDSTSQKLKDALTDNDIDYLEYPAGDQQARVNLVNEIADREDLRFMPRESNEDFIIDEDEEETPYNGEKDFRLTERYREALTGMGYDRTDDQIVRLDPESEAEENRGNVPAYNKYPPRDEQTRRAMDRISKTSRPNPRDMEKVASSFDQADTNRMKADKEIAGILSALYRYASVGNEELSSDEYGQSLIDMAYMAAKAIVGVNSSYGAYTGGDPKGFYLDRFANDLLNDVLLINGNVIARGEFGMVPASELDSARREYESARKQDRKEIDRLTRKNEETEKRFGEWAATEKKRDAQRRLDADKALREALRNNKKIERSRAGIQRTSEKRRAELSATKSELKKAEQKAAGAERKAASAERRADRAELEAKRRSEHYREKGKQRTAQFNQILKEQENRLRHETGEAVYNAVQAERRQAVRERATQKTLQNVTKLRRAVSNTRYEMPESITSLTNTVLDMFDGNSLMMPEDLQHTVASVMTAVQELALPEDGDIYRGLINDITTATEAMSRMPQLYEMSAMAPRAYDETAAATNAEKYEDAVNTMVTATEHIVRRFNAQAKFMSKITQEVQKDIDASKFGEKGKVRGALDQAGSMLNSFLRRAVMEEPYVARRIGGTFADLMDDFRRTGEKQYWDCVFGAQQKLNSLLDKYDARKYIDGKNKNPLKFTTHEGKALTLELTQAMGVYAVWLRERANVDENGKRRTAHLEAGGIMFTGGKMADGTRVPQSTGKFRLNDSDMRTIREFLDKDGRNMTGLVKETIRYMTDTVGEWGNKASLKMYGVRKFTDMMYYPFETVENTFIARDKADVSGEMSDGKKKTQKFSNMGMSKDVTADAMNPVKVNNFFDVVAGHINSVAAYGAYAEGQQNLLWILNYRTAGTETEAGSVFSEYLDDAYGRGTAAWVNKWLSDLSGGQEKDNAFGAKLFRSFKGAAVAANLSVTLKQPTSIGRALAYLGPQYFLGNPFNAGGIRTDRNAYNEAMKYSGAAKSKLAGGSFDINDGRSAAEFMLQKSGKRINNLQDATGFGARIADEVTWGNIWNACKRWTRKNMPALTGEEFMQATAQKFDEVVQLTQVYDEQMIKSELMRSQSFLAKNATMFMSEPMKQLNMLSDAFYQVQKNPKSADAWKYFARTNGALLVQALLTAAATGLVKVFRDRDEEKELPERFVAGVVDGAVDELNILSKIPFIKDLISMLQGYDVSRGDMELIADLITAVGDLADLLDPDSNTLAKLDAKAKAYKYADVISRTAGTMTSFFGLPVNNVYRDVMGLVRSAPKLLTVGNESAERLEWALKEGLRDAFTIHLGDKFERSAFDFLIPTAGEIGESLLAGDTKKAEEQMTELASYLAYTGDDKTTQTIRSKLYDIVKKYVEDGQIDDDTARDYVYKYLAHKAKSDGTQQTYTEDEAYWLVKKWHFLKEHPDEQFREYNDLDKAIDQKADLTDAINELTAHGFTEAQADQRVYNHLKNRFDNGEISADEARDLLEYYAEYAHNKKTTGLMAQFETQKNLGELTDKEYDELLKLYGQDADYLDPLHYARQKVEEWEQKKENGSYSLYGELDAAIQSGKSTAKAVEHLEWLGVRESSIESAASTGLNIAVNKYYAEQIAKTGTGEAQRTAAAAKTGKYAEQLYKKYVSDDENKAWEKGIKTEYRLNNPGSSGGSVYSRLDEAFDTGKNFNATLNEYTEHGKKASGIFGHQYGRYYTQYCMAYQKSDTATMGAIYNDLVKWSNAVDYSSDKYISKTLTRWRGKVDDGTWKESSDYDPEYKYERRR